MEILKNVMEQDSKQKGNNDWGFAISLIIALLILLPVIGGVFKLVHK